MLARIARVSYRRRWLVLAAWVAVMVASQVFASAFGGEQKMSFSLPNTDSQRAFDLLEAKFPARAGDEGSLVIRAATTPDGVRDPGVQTRVAAVLDQISKVDGVAGVRSPYASTPQAAQQISRDGQIAYASIDFVGVFGDGLREGVGKDIEKLVDPLRTPDLQAELGGFVFSGEPEFSSEFIGIIAAMIILLVAFGSLLAMGLPLLTAIFGIGIGLAILTLLANILEVPGFAPQVASMIGIGVGIDYALFIVTRFRSGLREGRTPEEAVVKSIDTAGRAVIFAGCTVIISVLGLFLMGVSFVQGLAIGTSVAVLVIMIGSITLLPAMLGFVGLNIDKLSVNRLFQRKDKERSERSGFWVRWSNSVQRHPWRFLVAGIVPLLLFTAPVFSIRLGFADAGNDPPRMTTRKAYDLLSQGFGPGFNGPFVAVAQLPPGTNPSALEPLQQAFQGAPGVAFATPPQPNPAGDTAIFVVFPTTSPQDEATSQLLTRLRTDVVPNAVRGTGVTVFIGGQGAASEDAARFFGSRLPLFFGAVLVLSFLLLMIVFRSLLVPLKAVIMNLLSIGAAFGAVVAVFQWGWVKSIVDIGREGPVEAWLPMMLFAVVFGLSMDYEVFLLSRIKEEYDHTRDNATAVAHGLALTARVITAAALIMVCVFGSFLLSELRPLKMIGFGLGFAVLIDATIVRMILVPATMELLGDRNWWLPRWLGRALPKVNIEGAEEPVLKQVA